VAKTVEQSDRFSLMQTEVIVEIGNSHEGSLGIAKCFIDMAKTAGASVVKFQMHISEFESSDLDEFRVKFSDQDKSRVDYWDRVAFAPEQWQLLSNYCDSQDIEFLCTPFSIEAAEILMEVTSIKRWKVGSGDAVNFPLIDYLISTEFPLIISTGLISWEELMVLKDRLMRLGAWSRTTLMHCVSQYPTPIENSGLNMINELRELGCSVGLSDHSGRLSPSLMAISCGISSLEVHLTPHHLFFGPDVSSSLTTEQIKVISEFARDVHLLNANPRSKSYLFENASQTRKLFRKGVYWNYDLKAGTTIQYSDLIFLKPSQEIDSFDFEKVVGKVLTRPVTARKAAKFDDFQ
jgi:N,N'-diacetyllegionaminate synthase